jgi:hypothetical protein
VHKAECDQVRPDRKITGAPHGAAEIAERLAELAKRKERVLADHDEQGKAEPARDEPPYIEPSREGGACCKGGACCCCCSGG